MSQLPLLVGVPDAMRALSIGKTSVFCLIKNGKLEVRRIGRRTLITTASIRALADGEPLSGGAF